MESKVFYFLGEDNEYTHRFEIRKDGYIEFSEIDEGKMFCSIFTKKQNEQFINFLKSL